MDRSGTSMQHTPPAQPCHEWSVLGFVQRPFRRAALADFCPITPETYLLFRQTARSSRTNHRDSPPPLAIKTPVLTTKRQIEKFYSNSLFRFSAAFGSRPFWARRFSRRRGFPAHPFQTSFEIHAIYLKLIIGNSHCPQTE